MGDDLQIPFRRVPDRALIANEKTFAAGAKVLWDTPTWAALWDGNILTDDFYGDRIPFRWKGRHLYLPDVAVGRLVETPDEMRATIGAFLDTPTLVVATALDTGYDFLTDSATAIADTMASQGVAPTTLIGEHWNADDLKAAWSEAKGPVDLASVNGHYEHWRTQPATDTASTPIFYNTDILNATNTFTGSVNYSMGCHGGLNVPDQSSVPNGPGLHDTWNPDYPQVFGRKGAAWIANTGYGYGMDDAIAGSEQVYLHFQRMLGSEDVISVGEALRRAKWAYVQQLGAGGLGVYEEKSLIEATLYGLPMYRVNMPRTVSVSGPARQVGGGDSGQVTAAAGTYTETQVDLSLGAMLVLTSTDAGQYYHIAHDVQASGGRPLQPRYSEGLVPPDGEDIHGVIVWSAALSTTEGFDPVIYRPVTDTALAEPAFTSANWYPNKFWSLNSLDPSDTRLVVIAGQYRSTNGTTGTERVFTDLTFKVFTSQSSDGSPPAILRVEADRFEQQPIIRAEVSDTDSGVDQVWCTFEHQQGSWRTEPLAYNAESGMWEGAISSALDKFDFFVQAVDCAGNVSVSSNKGLYFAATPDETYLPVVLRDLSQ